MDKVTAVVVFNVVHAIGFFIPLLFVLTALLSSKITRLPTWYTLMSASMVYCGSMLILPMIRRQVSDTPPESDHWDVCLFQAALVYASPAFLSAAGAAYALQLFLMFTYYTTDNSAGATRKHVSLLVFPPLIFFAIIIEVVIFGTLNAKHVRRDDSSMFCHFDISLPVKITGAISGIAGTALLIFQGCTLVLVRRHWQKTHDVRVRSNGLISRAMLVRLILFDVVVVAAVIVALTSFGLDFSSAIVNISQGCLNAALTLVFGLSVSMTRGLQWFRRNRNVYASNVHLGKSVEVNVDLERLTHVSNAPAKPTLVNLENVESLNHVEAVPEEPVGPRMVSLGRRNHILFAPKRSAMV